MRRQLGGLAAIGFVAIGWAAAVDAAAAERVEDAGRVVDVTVFQGQALVARQVALPEREGLIELIVTGLPERLLEGSLYAEPGEGVEVRSVRTRNRAIDAAPREEVEQLQAELRELDRRVRSVSRQQQVNQQRTTHLDGVAAFTAGAGKSDLQSGVLDAVAIREVTKLLFEQRAEVAEREVQLAVELEDLQEQRSLLQRRLQSLAGGSDRTRREAVVFLQKQPGASSVRLNYLVGGATWSPSYNLRASEDNASVTIEYNASVTQTSGEDWDGVRMTLSTATPSLVAAAPELEPFTIRLGRPAQDKAKAIDKLSLARQQRALASNRGNSIANQAADDLFGSASEPAPSGPFGGFGGGEFGGGAGGGFGAVYTNGAQQVADMDRQLNTFACAIQLSDLNSALKKERAEAMDSDTEGVSVVYELEGATSLPSRTDKQLIQIASLELEADTRRVATPVLTSYVYLQAELTNTSDLVLLEGPAATFHGDRFVGRGQTPSVAVGESFTVGLGIDESLRATRRLLDRSQRVQGGNRIVTLRYELSIENFAESPAEVRVLDRLPRADDDAIKISLAEASSEVADGPGDDGAVAWEVTAPGAAAGDDALRLTYALSIEHDKQLVIVGGDPVRP